MPITIDIEAKDSASGIIGGIFDLIRNNANAFDVAVAGAMAFADFIGDSVNEAFEYNEAIKGIADSTGLTAEETSRLVQTLDDAGIGMDTVKKALREMQKDGLEPNIDDLAALSDEFLTLNTGAERGQFLIEHFGKSGEQMARVMSMGGDAIRDMNAAVSDNLIVTDAAIAASEEYRMNVDQLNDAWTGFKITVGNAVIPVMNQMYTTQVQQNAAFAQARAELGNVHESLIRLRAAEILQTEATNAASTARMNGLASLYDTTSATEDLGQATELTADEIKAMSSANNANLSLINQLQDEMQGYNEKLAETTELYGENSQEVKDLQQEHSQAMEQIAYDLYLAKLQADGLTDAEFEMGLQAGVSAGILDQATVDMALSFDEAASAAASAGDETGAAFIDAAGNITDAKSAAEALGGVLDDIEGNYNITVTTTWENIGDSTVGHILDDNWTIVEAKAPPSGRGSKTGGYSSPMTQSSTVNLSPETIRLLAMALREQLAPVLR